MTQQILFVDLDRDWAVSFLKREFTCCQENILYKYLPLSEALAELGDQRQQITVLSPFISSAVGPGEMAQLPELKLIATRSTGFDHIDLEAAHQRGITVCNVPVYGDNTVAEHTFALILSLSRKLRETYERVRRDEFNLTDLEGFDLRCKTIGVIGTGHIGLRVVQIARGFSMNVLAFDPKEQPLLADVLDFRYAPFEEVLANSDIVTLHAPHNRHTHHLMNANTISKMKKSSLLINTSRGGLVDSDALLAALRSGHLTGAGLDVLEDESILIDEDQARAGLQDIEKLRTTVLNHMLLSRDNVIFTPHLAFNSREANERIYSTTAQNICAFCEGKPVNVIQEK